jgi:hypothetical protein
MFKGKLTEMISKQLGDTSTILIVAEDKNG